jgi:hypothetical protein
VGTAKSAGGVGVGWITGRLQEGLASAPVYHLPGPLLPLIGLNWPVAAASTTRNWYHRLTVSPGTVASHRSWVPLLLATAAG